MRFRLKRVCASRKKVKNFLLDFALLGQYGLQEVGAEMDKTAINSVDESFVVLLTSAQCDLHAYVAYLLGGRDEARDVMQETNLVLWREAARYDPTRPFLPWAKSIAYYRVLTHLKKKSRERLVFDEDMVMRLAEVDAGHHDDLHDRLKLLDGCLEKLTPTQRAVIKYRYHMNWAVQQIARKFACSDAAMSMMLTRIRRALAACLKQAMNREVHP